MRLQFGLLALWASTAMAGTCQSGTVEGPYTAQNVAFDVICGKGLTGTSYTTQASMMAGAIEECMVACAVDSSCIAIVWDNIGSCSLFSSYSAMYSDYTDIAIRQQPSTSTSVAPSTTSSAAVTSSAPPQCQAGTYTSSTDNVQFNTACGRYYVGTEISNSVAADLQGCMDMCASDSNCVAVSLSYSGNVCHLFSHTDYSTPDASWDLAVVSSRPSSTSSTSSADSTSSVDTTSAADSTSSGDSTSTASSATSSTPPACQDGTYSGTINQFTITCNASPNGYQTLSSLGTGYTLETCLQACDVDSQCDGAVFSEQSGYCIVYQGALSSTYSSVGADYIYKMPATSSSSSSSSVSSTTSISLTSSTTSSSPSSTTSSAPLTCAQLGSTYTGASNTVFEVTCGAILGGSPSSNTQVNSVEQCMDLCQIDPTCLGVSFFGSMNRCYSATVYVGSSAAPPYDVAIIPARLPSTSSTSSVDSTSTSAKSASLTTVGSSTETFTSPSSASTSTVSTSSTSTSFTSTSTTSISAISSSSTPISSSFTSPTSASSTSRSSDTSSSTTSSMATSSTFTSLTSAFMSSSATSSEVTSATATTFITTSLTTTTSTPSTPASISTTLLTSSEPNTSESTSWSASTLKPETPTSAELSVLSSIVTSTATLTIETSTVLTSARTENPSSETSANETTTMSLSSKGSEASSSRTSQTTTETESTVLSTQQPTSPVRSVSPSESSTSASLTISTTSTTPSTSPRNIQVLDGYDFVACLRSDEGFPTFTEVSTQANMTTEICVKLAAGSIYVGVYEETCYKADSLAGSEVVEDERCGLRCPGNPTLFCGGTTGGAAASSSSSPSSNSLSSSSPSSGASQASGTRALSSTSGSIAQISYTQSVPSSSISSRATAASLSIFESGSISSTPSPTKPGLIRTIHVTRDVTYTEIVIAETVTTVSYVTIDPSQPEVFITTCIPVTLQYTPCNCDHQEYPPVDMTTITSSCDACGYQGQDVLTMVVPVAACESDKPSGWIEGEAWNHGYPDYIEGHQTYAGNAAGVESQPQPTQGKQNGEGQDYENGSTDIEAAIEGSGGEVQNKQPTQVMQNGKGPDYKNRPFSTKAASQRPEDEAPNEKTANPLPTQGQQNTNRPGDENDQSSIAVETSAEHNAKNGPIVSASQPSNALNPPKPLPPHDQQLSSSDGLPIETSVVSSLGPDTPTSPSQLVPVHGHHPAVSTTFATEIEITKEAEASESTHSLNPLEHGEASSIPSIVSSSEGYRHHIMYWSMMVVIVGVVQLL
ncbi:related to MUC1-Extracellular alpha-1,4-glucan glucosidase [Fusarium mangiferae]|uniref:Related to MUC1-Extracellular alpha-1,4-glucan glucosidase n=1 Tax=Fusarium mangiferae TaxID=192010 RepID=A0A1L7TSY6_FUSMA|nr:uncharacterized protein FMAN_08447 [Fusarium mangiferae]CVK98775.1 related to MUC1-Extracellular alpha-1,4-glucan glucosidase [Fusarium mangiferae]